ncbi:MAG: hypothetical protein FI682_06115 [SAR202 cluster bacterium]|nr:hypothetical protein [SAR202 cluster bacterium]
MQDNSSEKELFKKLLENKNIKLSEKDFNQSYITYLNFRKIYSSIKEHKFDNFEPRQRNFGE